MVLVSVAVENICYEIENSAKYKNGALALMFELLDYSFYGCCRLDQTVAMVVVPGKLKVFRLRYGEFSVWSVGGVLVVTTEALY